MFGPLLHKTQKKYQSVRLQDNECMSPKLLPTYRKLRQKNMVQSDYGRQPIHFERKDQQDSNHKHIKMKKKFENLYRKIQQIGSREQLIKKRNHALVFDAPLAYNNKVQNIINSENLNSKKLQLTPIRDQNQNQNKSNNQYLSLINTTVNNQQCLNLKKNRSMGINKASKSNRNGDRYHKPFLPKIAMSNRIKDYLSVQKIELKEVEQQIVNEIKSLSKKLKSKDSNLLNTNHNYLNKKISLINIEQNKDGEITVDEQIARARLKYKSNHYRHNNFVGKTNIKFNPPFNLYYYRDFLWKIGYSNQMIVEPPVQYGFKMRVYFGSGNNTNLIKGIIRRRPWWQPTEKINQAQLVWTQIKNTVCYYYQRKKIKKDFDENYVTTINNNKEKIHKQKEQQLNINIINYDNQYANISQNNESQIIDSKNQIDFNKKISDQESIKHDQNSKKNNNFQPKQIATSYIKQFTLLNEQQLKKFDLYWKKYYICENKMKENFYQRNKLWQIKPILLEQVQDLIGPIHNHFSNNYLIGNKKALFQTMSEYYTTTGQKVFNFLPLTFHIKEGIQDDQYLKFLQYFYQIAKKNKQSKNEIQEFYTINNQLLLRQNNLHNAWIVKPGQNTNRGNGIIMCLGLKQIKNILKKRQSHADGTLKTYIIQKYIEKPALYKRRKFDLRHYILLNSSNGIIKGYWYKHGYVRTTSSEYTLKMDSGSVHLTNDAVQKYSPDYGKYQKGNKLSYEDLDIYLRKNDSKFDFWKQIYPKMKKIGFDCLKACAKNIQTDKYANNFELFGMDFMIDRNYRVWLIQINSNPCLEISCPLLGKIIPSLIQNIVQITVDPIYPAPLQWQPKLPFFKGNLHQDNNFQMIFDERVHQLPSVGQSWLEKAKQFQDDEDIFEDEGEIWEDE